MSAAHEVSVEPFLPPGPPLPSLVQTLAWGARPWQFLTACRRRYGPTFTLRLLVAGPTVVVSEPEDIRRVFSLRPEEFDIGYTNADLLEPLLGSRSVVAMDGADHGDERRRLQHAFRAERLETYAELVHAATLADMAGWPRRRPFPIHERTRDHSRGDPACRLRRERWGGAGRAPVSSR